MALQISLCEIFAEKINIGVLVKISLGVLFERDRVRIQNFFSMLFEIRISRVGVYLLLDERTLILVAVHVGRRDLVENFKFLTFLSEA